MHERKEVGQPRFRPQHEIAAIKERAVVLRSENPRIPSTKIAAILRDEFGGKLVTLRWIHSVGSLASDQVLRVGAEDAGIYFYRKERVNGADNNIFLEKVCAGENLLGKVLPNGEIDPKVRVSMVVAGKQISLGMDVSKSQRFLQKWYKRGQRRRS